MMSLYRHAADPEVSWRDRHVFAGRLVEIRSPLNDLRLVEFLAATPDWIKRFDGYPRDILRAALRNRGLPEVAERLDKGFYEEQLHVGLAEQETGRLMTAVRTLAGLRGVHAEATLDEATRWLARRHRWSRPTYRCATAGLWLRQVTDPSSSPTATDVGRTNLLGERG
jgi:hypothetical protein